MSKPESWQSICARKQSQRASLIPSAWIIPSDYLPTDPPLPSHGPQNVLHVPSICGILTPQEIQITESYTAKSLLAAIASQELSAAAVATAFCKRAAIAHQLTNCLTEILFEDAISRARALDERLKKTGKPIGPLHGLPVTVKDTFNIVDVDSCIGTASLCFNPARENAPLVDLLLSLGCVVVAKTNVPQTLSSLDSVNNVFGRTMNPINRLCTAGGSSGGEGVCVAMRASMIGWGTDIGGSIRVPAMCNGVYGFKPSSGRIPYGGQTSTDPQGLSRASVQSVAGPIARCLEDIDVVMREVVPRGSLWARDCNPGGWSGKLFNNTCGRDGSFRVGILRSDGNTALLPPIMNIMNEVGEKLRKSGVQVVDLPTPAAWTKCQSVMSKLLGVEGNHYMADLLDATGEPLVPWMQSRFKRNKPKTLQEIAELQARRSGLETEMLKLWIEDDGQGGRRKRFGAIICPVAPHPVPEIDRYNAVGYTSSFVMLDWPAGTIPLRNVTENDLELGKPQDGNSLGSWDDRNRELWDEKKVDRRVYLGTPLSIQVVTPRLEDERLIQAMHYIDDVLQDQEIRAKI